MKLTAEVHSSQFGFNKTNSFQPKFRLY